MADKDRFRIVEKVGGNGNTFWIIEKSFRILWIHLFWYGTSGYKFKCKSAAIECMKDYYRPKKIRVLSDEELF